MNESATPTEVTAAPTSDPPATRAAAIVRYTAMTRSSNTSVPSNGSASSLAIQPRSMSDFVMMADEEM